MSVQVETRSRARFLPRGVRRFLGTNAPQSSSNSATCLPNTPVAHVNAMFQDAQNTTIQSPIFNIYAAGTAPGAGSPPDSRILQPSSSGLSPADTSIPTHLISGADFVLPADPIPGPKTSPEIYVHHLMTKNRGYPLWIPSPNMLLPASCRASGVRIGDVGIITPEGGFSYLFNVFHEATHPINASMRLPRDFSAFARASELSSSDVDQFKESSAGSYLADESLVRMDAGDDRSKTILQTSATHAAALMMPEAVYASKLKSTVLLRKYVRDNIRSWYRFVKTVLGCEVDNGDIRVVYGCRKSAAFGIATVSNGGAAGSSTELTFSVDSSWTEITGCKYGWHHRGSAEVKSGPSLDENQDIRQEGVINNQCLFVSTIDFTLPDEEWERIKDDELASITTSDCLSTRSGSTFPSAEYSISRGGGQSNSGHTSLSGSGSGKGVYSLSHRGAFTLGQPDERESWPNIPPSEPLFHPSDVLAQFLLWIVPQATSVALHSDDWGPYMTSSVQTLAVLIHRVLSAHDICEDDGMIYLNPKEVLSSAQHPGLENVVILPELVAEDSFPHNPSYGSVPYKDKIMEKRTTMMSSFPRPMLLKTPTVNARPFHITVKISEIMAVVGEISGGFSQSGMLLALQIIFPERHAKKYIVHIHDDYRRNSHAIAHTRASDLLEWENQLELASTFSVNQATQMEKDAKKAQSGEGWSNISSTSLSDKSTTNTSPVSRFITEVDFVSRPSGNQASPMRVKKTEEQENQHKMDTINTTLSETAVILGLVNEAAQFSQVPGLRNAASLVLENVTIAQEVGESNCQYHLLVKDITDFIASIRVWHAYQQPAHRADWLPPSMGVILTELNVTLDDITRFVKEKTNRGKSADVFFSNSDISQVLDYRECIEFLVKKFELASHLKLNQMLQQLHRDHHQIAERLSQIGIDIASPAAMFLHALRKSSDRFDVDASANTLLTAALSSSVVSSQRTKPAKSPHASDRSSLPTKETLQSPRISVPISSGLLKRDRGILRLHPKQTTMAEEIPQFVIHPLLVYEQHQVFSGCSASLTWDLHKDLNDVHLVGNPGEPLGTKRLMEDATSPPLTTLTITCGVFPEDWPIVIKQKHGITVGDVLRAIYDAVHRRITHEDWRKLSSKDEAKITATFEERCSKSKDPIAVRQNGVLRIDFLLRHTFFAGLSVSPDKVNTCVLTVCKSPTQSHAKVTPDITPTHISLLA